MPDSSVSRSGASLPERREPSHTLMITVPLNLDANPAAESYDIKGALGEALRVVLPLVRVGTLGLLCDDPIVTLGETEALAEALIEVLLHDGSLVEFSDRWRLLDADAQVARAKTWLARARQEARDV